MPNYSISDHARFEMNRRGLAEEVVLSVLDAPEQRLQVRPGRIVLQSRISMGSPAKTYLIRVFVDLDTDPPEVVTVYRTSKVAKYWRQAS